MIDVYEFEPVLWYWYPGVYLTDLSWLVVDREGRLEENSRGGFSTLDFYIKKRGEKGEGIWCGVETARVISFEKLPSNLLKRHTFSCIFLKSLNLVPRHCRLPFRHGLCLGLKDTFLFVRVTKFPVLLLISSPLLWFLIVTKSPITSFPNKLGRRSHNFPVCWDEIMTTWRNYVCRYTVREGAYRAICELWIKEGRTGRTHDPI